MSHHIPDTDSPLVRFLRSLIRRKPRPGLAGQSAKPKLLHKSLTLRRSSLTLRRSRGPGSLEEHDRLVGKVGAVMARRIERLGSTFVRDCLDDTDPCSYAQEATKEAA